MSTFIVECDPATWSRAGFDSRTEDETRALCEQVFADTLQGHPLMSNRSIWRNFPWIWNERWSHRNMVLLGDALHTAHYSIGSGTRLALEDALALAKALEAERRRSARGARRYEATRRPIVEKLVERVEDLGTLVRALSRAHAARADRSRHELHLPLRPHRRRAPAGHGAALHAPLREPPRKADTEREETPT